MLENNKLEELRRIFNLNIYEAKVWTALLSRGISTAGELSDIVNVPRSRTYDVLESLEKKGFILMKIGKPIKYIAIEPEEIIRRVKKSIHRDTDVRVSILEKVKQSPVYDELKLLHQQELDHVMPEKLSGSIKGRKEIYTSLREAISRAKESVLLVTTSDGLKRKAKALNAVLKRAKKNGTMVEVLAPLHDNIEEEIPNLKSIVKLRHIDSVRARYVIVDSQHLLLFLHEGKDAPENDTAIWVKSAIFGNTLKNFTSKGK